MQGTGGRGCMVGGGGTRCVGAATMGGRGGRWAAAGTVVRGMAAAGGGAAWSRGLEVTPRIHGSRRGARQFVVDGHGLQMLARGHLVGGGGRRVGAELGCGIL
jgi:hypothetical protein